MHKRALIRFQGLPGNTNHILSFSSFLLRLKKSAINEGKSLVTSTNKSLVTTFILSVHTTQLFAWFACIPDALWRSETSWHEILRRVLMLQQAVPDVVAFFKPVWFYQPNKKPTRKRTCSCSTLEMTLWKKMSIYRGQRRWGRREGGSEKHTYCTFTSI